MADTNKTPEFKDLIFAQKGQTEQMSDMAKSIKIQEQLAKQDKAFQIVQTYNSIKSIKDEDKLVKTIEKLEKDTQKGLLDKTGDGLNSNVIQLRRDIGKTFEGLQKTLKPLSEIKPKDMIAAEAAKYKPGAKDAMLGAFKKNVEQGGEFKQSGMGFLTDKIKKLGTLEGWVEKREDGDAPKSFADAFFQKKHAKNAYKKAMKKAAPQTDNIMDADKVFGEQFEKRNESLKGMKQYSDDMLLMKREGVSERTMKASGWMDKKPRELQEQYLASTGKDGRLQKDYNEEVAKNREKIEREQINKNIITEQEKGKVIPLVKPSVDGASALSEEEQHEAIRMQETQIELLEKIEENTRAFKGFLSKAMGKGGSGEGEESEGEGGGSDFLIMNRNKGPKGPKGPKKPGMFSKLAKGAGKFLSGARGGLLGGALAVGTGAYVGYKGWTGASEEEDQQLAQIDESVKSGKISEEEAAKLKEEVSNKTDVKQGGAAGQGLGIAAGGIDGMKLGATIGTFVGGPVGTVVGGALGGIAGGIAGSSAGKAIGEYGVKGYKAAKNFLTGEDKNGETRLGKAGKFALGGLFPAYGMYNAAKGMFGGGDDDEQQLQETGEDGAIKDNKARLYETNIDERGNFTMKDRETGEDVTDEKTKLERLKQKRAELEKKGPRSDYPTTVRAHEEKLALYDKAIKKLDSGETLKTPPKDGEKGYLEHTKDKNKQDTNTIKNKSGSGFLKTIAGGLFPAYGMYNAAKGMFGGGDTPETQVDSPLQNIDSMQSDSDSMQSDSDSMQSIEQQMKQLDEDMNSGKISTMRGTHRWNDLNNKLLKKKIEESRNAKKSGVPLARPPSGADSVYSKSSEVADAQRQAPAAAPSQVAINAPQTNIQNSNNYIAKLPPRNTESSWREYDRMKHGFRMA